jgi:hypothetical protein
VQTPDQQIAALKRSLAAYEAEGNKEAAKSARAKLAKLTGDRTAADRAPVSDADAGAPQEPREATPKPQTTRGRSQSAKA